MKTTHQLKCQEYYRQNREAILLKRKEDREANIEAYKLKDKVYYETNKNSISTEKKKKRNYSLSYRLSALLGNSKARSKKLGYDFDLTKDFLFELWNKQEGRCALTNDVLSIEEGQSRWTGSLVSLDRIDSTRGYTKDNVQFVTSSANYAKGSLTMDEFVNLCKKVIAHAPHTT